MAQVTTMTPKHRRPSAKKQAAAVSAEAIPPLESPPPDSKPVESAPETPKDEKAKRGRPKVGTPHVQEPPFFDLVRKVPAEDWGTRAFMYVYLQEPVCDPKTFGKYSYLLKSSQPITDLQQLMEDYGSFAGYMTLNQRKMGQNGTDLIDTYSFEIYNPKYPPKMPREAWLNDARNKKWAALLPKDQPAAQHQASGKSEAEMFQTFLGITREIEERAEARYARDEPEPPPNPADQFATVVSTAKDLMSMAQPKKEDDGIIRDELKALRDELAAERAENRLLLREMLNSKTTAPVGATDPLDMFDKMMDRVDKIKERVAPEANGAEAIRQSRMSGMQEFALETIKGIFNSPVAANLTQLLVMATAAKMQGNQPQQSGHSPTQPTGLPSPTQPQPVTQPNPGAPVKMTSQQFGQIVIPQFIEPLMLHLTDKEKDGYDLAEHVINGKGKFAYDSVKAFGVDFIMQAFTFTPYWQGQQPGVPGLSAMEPQLRELIEEFCSWPPPDEPEESNGPTEAGEPINLMETGE